MAEEQQGLVPNVVLGEELGRGGFARVYRGTQVNVGREVAVKIDSRVLDDDRGRRRFLREVTAAGRISAHPHVVSLIDAGTTADGRPFLVMELCSGGTLTDMIRRTGPLHAADARDLGLAVVGAVAAAHEVGILHRDIKPSNVLIDAYGTPRLADFGLAALPVPGQEMSVTLEALTPAYAAPEAFSGVEPTAASDVWSLGATIHALISPYRSPRWSQDGSPAPIDVLVANLAEPLPDPGAPGTAELMAVVHLATHPDPSQRFATADELYDALKVLQLPPSPGAALVGGPEAAFTAHAALPASARVQTLTRRPSRMPVVAAAVAGLVLGGSATWAADRALGSGPEATRTTATSQESTPLGGSDQPSDDSSAASDDEASDAAATAVGECFGGLVTIAGIRTARTVDCGEPHRYESFASGLLDPSTQTLDIDEVAQDSVVQETCTEAAVAQYVGGAAGSYDIEVLPPTEIAFSQGDAGFRCLASAQDAGETTGSLVD